MQTPHQRSHREKIASQGRTPLPSPTPSNNAWDNRLTVFTVTHVIPISGRSETMAAEGTHIRAGNFGFDGSDRRVSTR